MGGLTLPSEEWMVCGIWGARGGEGEKGREKGGTVVDKYNE